MRLWTPLKRLLTRAPRPQTPLEIRIAARFRAEGFTAAEPTPPSAAPAPAVPPTMDQAFQGLCGALAEAMSDNMAAMVALNEIARSYPSNPAHAWRQLVPYLEQYLGTRLTPYW